MENDRLPKKPVTPESAPEPALTDDEKIDIAARRILERYKPAFLELAK